VFVRVRVFVTGGACVRDWWCVCGGPVVFFDGSVTVMFVV